MTYFLNSSKELYLNVELIIHVLCASATSMSVGLYKAHSNKHRPIYNERAEMELTVAVNGPLLQHADKMC